MQNNNKLFKQIYGSKSFNFYYSTELNTVAYEQLATDMNDNLFATDYSIFILMPPLLKLMDKFLETGAKAKEAKKELSQYLAEDRANILTEINNACKAFLDHLQAKGYPKNLVVYNYDDIIPGFKTLTTINQINKSNMLYEVKHNDTHSSFFTYTIDDGNLYLYDVYAYHKTSNGQNIWDLISFKVYPLINEVCYKLLTLYQKQISEMKKKPPVKKKDELKN